MFCATGCGTELVPEFDGPMRRRDDWTKQYRNALDITSVGGYGMFHDPEFGRTYRDQTLVICHNCAHKLIAENPWLRQIISDDLGHMVINHQEGETAEGHPTPQVFGNKTP